MSSFIHLTRPDGSPVMVAKEDVKRVTPANTGEWPAVAKTVLFTGSGVQAVKETMAAVQKMLEA